ncbi:MAG: hypothetical protein J6B76_05675, partial [Peptococcaceae bacterium]|nr:hypothetical protein [Peptococcaceae bacterium]
MKHKKLTALILCFTMMFSITSGIFSAAFASDSTTGSAYHLDTTTGSSISTGRVWDSTTNGAYDIEKDKNESSSKPLMLFSTKAATTTPSASEYEANIEKTATFNEAYDGSFIALDDEPTASWGDNSLIYFKEDFSDDIQFEIVDAVVLSDTYEDFVNNTTNETIEVTELTLWYQVNIIDGKFTNTDEKVPTFKDGYWILQNYLNEEDAHEQDVLILSDAVLEATNPCAICGVVNCTTAHLYCEIHGIFDCGEEHDKTEPVGPATAPVIPDEDSITFTDGVDVSIVDEYGAPVTSEGLILAQGVRTSISAWSDLEDEGNVSYQWQICYDKDNNNNLWTDIQNQTGKGILISPAMVQSIIDATGEALIRCEITSGDTVQYSAEIPVTVAQSASPAMARFALARTASNDAVVTDTETRASDTYSVVINYKFENGTIVADPYTATLAAGSNFKATVSFPMIKGYLPYLGE